VAPGGDVLDDVEALARAGEIPGVVPGELGVVLAQRLDVLPLVGEGIWRQHAARMGADDHFLAVDQVIEGGGQVGRLGGHASPRFFL
jgi:hypothetical protein